MWLCMELLLAAMTQSSLQDGYTQQYDYQSSKVLPTYRSLCRTHVYLIDNLSNLGLKAHVQHSVSLVQN